MEIIDSHCHLDVEDFDADREAVLADCRARGVNRFVVPGITAATWDRLLDVCRRYEGLYPALGLHPYYVAEHQQAHLVALEKRLADEPDLVAVGEIGLDFYIDNPDRERQVGLFEAQLAIAESAAMPVIVHARKAHNQVLKSLKHTRFTNGGIMHAFNGSLEQAREYIDLGFKLGFGGMITYERSRKLRRLVGELPLESMVMETDAPDMSGDICHGHRNSPQYLPHYLEVLVALRDESVEEVAQATSANTVAVLRLDRISDGR
jgi:TatD DNase family protein